MIRDEGIPVEKQKLLVILRDSLSEKDRPVFEQFAKLLEQCCHYKFHNFLHQLYGYYKDLFNPNAEFPSYTENAEEHAYAASFIEEWQKFLEDARYRRIGEYDIRDILYLTHRVTFKVIFPIEKYQDFVVYYRGESSLTQYYRAWYTLWLKKHKRHIPYYKKLVVLFRPFRVLLQKWHVQESQNGNDSNTHLAQPQPIILKVFENITHNYLPCIFPEILIKLAGGSALYLLGILLFSIALGIGSVIITSRAWYGLLALLPLTLLAYKLRQYTKAKESYYRELLAHCYYNHISTNKGVFRNIIDQSEEEAYKRLLLVFHAFWRKEVWAWDTLDQKALNQYLQKFLWDYAGVQSKLQVENTLVTCCNLLKDIWLPALVKWNSGCRSYVQANSKKEGNILDVEPVTPSLPYAGSVEIAPGTEKAEKNVFSRQPFLFHITEPEQLKFSHPDGAAIRWVVEKPYTTQLIADANIGSDVLLINNQDIDTLPLQGIGKVIVGEEHFDFRYYRHRNSNKLRLTGGLRYRHSVLAHAPVLVRPVLPSFTLPAFIVEGSSAVPLPLATFFPPTGLVRFAPGTAKDFIVAYSILSTLHGSSLYLEAKTPVAYEPGTAITFTPPLTLLREKMPKGSWLVPVKSTKHFSKRGILLLSPGTEREERLPFLREALLLELDKPLQSHHREGSFLQVEKNNNTKLIHAAPRGSHTILIHSLGEEIEKGTVSISPGQAHQEICHFHIRDKYLYLDQPTRYNHPANAEVWEANFESPLRYEAFQGSHLLVVEDATSFPLRGTLQINFNGNTGVKEVLPFERTQCSNTLLLTGHTDRLLLKGSRVSITAVEIVTGRPLHYSEKTVYADFSCVPSFPNEAVLLIEPGNQAEEKIKCRRYPTRFYLKTRLKNEHQQGTAINCPSPTESILTEPLRKGAEKIHIEFAHLLPEWGSLIFKTADRSDVVWYHKFPHRVCLEESCKYHHTRGSLITLPDISNHIALAAPVEKGSQELKVVNGQELSQKGKLEIKGLFGSDLIEFIREGDTLFLKVPIPHNFSMHARLNLPELYLQSHVTPGMDYLEVSDPSFLPSTGKLMLPPPYPAKMYSKKHRREETVSFLYQPDMLWFVTPLAQAYERGTVIISPELIIKGAGEFAITPLADAVEELKNWLAQQLNTVTRQRGEL